MNSINNGKVHILHLGPGEDLLLSIKQYLRDEDIRNGIILTGIGTLSDTSFHGVVKTSLPAKDEFFSWKDIPVEFSGMSGIIADYEPHIHMSFSSFDKSTDVKSVVAHIEPGCKILCLAEISILRLDDIEMERVSDDYGIKALKGEGLINS